MATDEAVYAPIRDIGGRSGRKTLSPVERTRALLERIERLEPTLHAFVTLTADRALAEAKAAETALARGDISSPLLGIPLGYKDIYATRGVVTTGGSALLADWVPDADSTCVARLQKAGAVMLGKLITHEFAFGIQFPGHRFPAAKNPWDLERMPGGSSSGSGTALAGGLGLRGAGTGHRVRRCRARAAAPRAGPARPGFEPGAGRRLHRAARSGRAQSSHRRAARILLRGPRLRGREGVRAGAHDAAAARRERPGCPDPVDQVGAGVHGHPALRGVRLPRAGSARAPRALRRVPARADPGRWAHHQLR